MSSEIRFDNRLLFEPAGLKFVSWGSHLIAADGPADDSELVHLDLIKRLEERLGIPVVPRECVLGWFWETERGYSYKLANRDQPSERIEQQLVTWVEAQR